MSRLASWPFAVCAVCCLMALVGDTGVAFAEEPGAIPTYASQFGTEGSGNGQINEPSFNATDGSGNVWVADSENDRIEAFTPSGAFIRAVFTGVPGERQYLYPVGIAVNRSAGLVYVTDYVADRSGDFVEEFSTSGEYIRSFGPAGSGGGQFSTPNGIAVDSNGNVWVVDTFHYRVEKFSSTGTFIAAYGTWGSGNGQFKEPLGITTDPSNHVYVTDGENERVEVLSTEGAFLGQFGSGGTGNGQFAKPYAIASDPASGNLLVTDQNNNRAEVFTGSGAFVGIFGSFGAANGQFYEPHGVTVDSTGGVYVVDEENSRVERWVLPVPLTGQPGFYALEEEEVGSETTASVNVAGGNLLVRSEDLAPAKATSYVGLNRYYNSQAPPAAGTLGSRWSWDSGPAVFLVDAGGSVQIHGPNGYVGTLSRQPDGSYTAPEGFEGTLTKNGDGTFTLGGGEGVTYQFTALGVLTGYNDEEGHVFTVTDTTAGGTSVLRAITATATGKSLEVTYDTAPHVTQTTDPEGHLRLYAYNAQGQLATYTAPSGKKTEYGYDTNGYLNRITWGTTVESITTTAGKVTEATITIKGKVSSSEVFAYQAPAGPTCSPERDAGQTVVTHSPQGGTPETFCYDALGEITAYSGPEPEADNTEGTEPQEEVPPGTCYADPEFPENYCGQEDPPPENEESGAGPAGVTLQAAVESQAASIPDLGPTHYGIADNNKLTGTPHFNYFGNSYFKALHVVNVRRTVPWDIVPQAESGDLEAQALLADVRTWVKDVKALSTNTGQPTISFDRCGEGKTVVDPANKGGPLISCDEPASVAQYRAAVTAFLGDPTLGQVKYFTPWNEPNRPPNKEGQKDEPPWHQPELAGKYWRVLDELCKPPVPKTPARCLVGAGDFLDTDMNNASMRNSNGGEYFHKYWLGMGHPKSGYRWAWHAYSDGEAAGTTFVHRPSEWWKRFKNFHTAIDNLSTYRPDIWLTEQGVEFLLGGVRQPASYCGCTATAIMHAYVEDEGNQLTRQSRQIMRFFYYSTRGDKNFDSGLLALNSTPRKIYYIYRNKTPTK
jgi:YD repeat-containing protein